MNPFVALDPLKTSKYEAGGMATITFSSIALSLRLLVIYAPRN